MQDNVIFHIDVNSAFLSWEAAKRIADGDSLDLRQIPSVIGGNELSRKGIVLAASIPAKRLGIKTGETLFSARTKCPNLIVAPPNFPLYMEYSEKLVALLFNYSPLVEQFSIDECFLDYKGMSPHFGKPLEGAQKIKDNIEGELGFTVNIGISTTKILAKMASDFEKPNKIHTLFKNEIETKMWCLPVRELFFVGGATHKRLSSVGVRTIGDLAKFDVSLLEKMLGAQGRVIWNYANGNDIKGAKVKSEHAALKCISNSTTLCADARTRSDATPTLLALCENVCLRLRRGGKTTSLVSVSIKYSDFTSHSRQMKVEATNSSTTIYNYVLQLFDSLWLKAPIRHLGVSLSLLEEEFEYQTTLFDDEKTQKQIRIDNVMDSIKKNYGKNAILKAATLDLDYVKKAKNSFHDSPITRSGLE